MEAAKTAAEAATNGAGDRVTSIRPVQTTFIPNNMTKGLLGMAGMFICAGYSIVKFNAHTKDVLAEAAKQS